MPTGRGIIQDIFAVRAEKAGNLTPVLGGQRKVDAQTTALFRIKLHVATGENRRLFGVKRLFQQTDFKFFIGCITVGAEKRGEIFGQRKLVREEKAKDKSRKTDAYGVFLFQSGFPAFRHDFVLILI